VGGRGDGAGRSDGPSSERLLVWWVLKGLTFRCHVLVAGRATRGCLASVTGVLAGILAGLLTAFPARFPARSPTGAALGLVVAGVTRTWARACAGGRPDEYRLAAVPLRADHLGQLARAAVHVDRAEQWPAVARLTFVGASEWVNGAADWNIGRRA
jgi:hypothetical protein